nr:retrovirus-related Pol polyprotein from transposon TNT 1-94 [Tanacetum cinerariifolium]
MPIILRPLTLQISMEGLVAEIFDWDEKEVYDDEEVTQVKVLIALADDELTVEKSHARNGEWIDITIRKSQAVNESLETLNTPESSKDSKAEFFTPLPPLKNLQGPSPSSEVMPLTFQPYSPKERPGLDPGSKGHNRVIHIKRGVLAESSQSNESSIGVKCNTCESTVHSTSDHNEFDHFKRGEKIQVAKAREQPKSGFTKETNPSLLFVQRHIREPIRYLDNGCSKSMTGVKSYLHKYVEQPGPKVVFGDNSSCITEGYGSINCG